MYIKKQINVGMAISCKNVLTLRATHVLTFGVFFFMKNRLTPVSCMDQQQ